MFIFVAKLSEENNAVYVGGVYGWDKTEEALESIRRRTGEEPVLLDEYTDKVDANIASSYISLISARLRALGYNVADKIDADSNRRLYVIHIGSPDTGRLYVGQTGYAIEVRFLQHKNKVLSNKGLDLSASIFRNGGNTPHSLAYSLILDTCIYTSTNDAEMAEVTLAQNLRALGYEVYSS